MHWIAVTALLSALLQSSQSLAVPAAAKTLQKDEENPLRSVLDADNAAELGDDEPLYAYVYEYEDVRDQIWSDCSKLSSVFIDVQDSHAFTMPPVLC